MLDAACATFSLLLIFRVWKGCRYVTPGEVCVELFQADDNQEYRPVLREETPERKDTVPVLEQEDNPESNQDESHGERAAHFSRCHDGKSPELKLLVFTQHLARRGLRCLTIVQGT